MRKTKEELNQIKKELSVNTLWSWSRINTYMRDSYEYMLKYILKIPEDRKDSIYAVSGGLAHDIMEDFYRHKLNHQEMLEKYEDKLFEFNTMGLMYERSDKEKNEKISKKYEDCMRHYFLNHKRMTDKPIIEAFVLIKVGNQFFQGYIDMIHVEKRGKRKKLVITDWKTSSIYTGEKLLKEAGQLLLYGEGMHQKTGMPYEDIIIRFNFMKYVSVKYTQKKGDVKVRHIERNAIGEKLQSNAKMWLKFFGSSEDDVEGYLMQMVSTNDIKCLPQEIQDKFEINDCYVEIELDEQIVSEHKDNIAKVIIEIVKKEAEFAKTKDKNIFWKDVDKESSYFQANLSGYSAKIHAPYKKYLEELDGETVSREKEDKIIADEFDWLDQMVADDLI